MNKKKSLYNPVCPTCGSRAYKNGIVGSLTKVRQTYRCTECGRCFSSVIRTREVVIEKVMNDEVD